MSCHTELSQESEVSIQNTENGLLNVAIKATKMNFRLKWLNCMSALKKTKI